MSPRNSKEVVNSSCRSYYFKMTTSLEKYGLCLERERNESSGALGAHL